MKVNFSEISYYLKHSNMYNKIIIYKEVFLLFIKHRILSTIIMIVDHTDSMIAPLCPHVDDW